MNSSKIAALVHRNLFYPFLLYDISSFIQNKMLDIFSLFISCLELNKYNTYAT